MEDLGNMALFPELGDEWALSMPEPKRRRTEEDYEEDIYEDEDEEQDSSSSSSSDESDEDEERVLEYLPQERVLEYLPQEIEIMIVENLPVESILEFIKSNPRRYRYLSNDELLWKALLSRDYPLAPIDMMTDFKNAYIQLFTQNFDHWIVTDAKGNYYFVKQPAAVRPHGGRQTMEKAYPWIYDYEVAVNYPIGMVQYVKMLPGMKNYYLIACVDPDGDYVNSYLYYIVGAQNEDEALEYFAQSEDCEPVVVEIIERLFKQEQEDEEEQE
jgi:hypothetical protein